MSSATSLSRVGTIFFFYHLYSRSENLTRKTSSSKSKIPKEDYFLSILSKATLTQNKHPLPKKLASDSANLLSDPAQFHPVGSSCFRKSS